MKKIERLKSGWTTEEALIYKMFDKVNELVDAHNEALDQEEALGRATRNIACGDTVHESDLTI